MRLNFKSAGDSAISPSPSPHLLRHPAGLLHSPQGLRILSPPDLSNNAADLSSICFPLHFILSSFLVRVLFSVSLTRLALFIFVSFSVMFLHLFLFSFLRNAAMLASLPTPSNRLLYFSLLFFYCFPLFSPFPLSTSCLPFQSHLSSHGAPSFRHSDPFFSSLSTALHTCTILSFFLPLIIGMRLFF